MVLEHIILDIKDGREADYEATVKQAIELLRGTPGLISLEVRRCVETPSRYLLLVQWRRIEDHLEGFRGSERYERWRALVSGFYEPAPMQHFGEPVAAL